MNKRIFFILILVCGLFAKVYAQKDFSNLTVIGNKTGKSTITVNELQKVFKGKYTNWSNGESVSIILPSPKTDLAESVAKLIYQTSVTSMQKFWLSLVFQGRFSPPVFTDNDQETIQQIQKNPGSIGVVDATTAGIPKALIIQVIK
jgi:ABC-type phosphate transport system substrate-binding protein